jgi:hypothetical protein
MTLLTRWEPFRQFSTMADGRYAVFASNAANWPGALQSNGKNRVWLEPVR